MSRPPPGPDPETARAEPYQGDARRGEIELLEQRRLFENAYVAVFNDRVLFPNGRQGEHFRWHWVAPYGVILLPRLPDGTVVLLEIFRHMDRAWRLEAPRGFGAADEAPEDAARREAEEECCLRVTGVHRLRSVGSAAYQAHLFLVDVVDEPVTCLPDGMESIASCPRFAPSTLGALLDDPRIHDAETLFLLSRHQARL